MAFDLVLLLSGPCSFTCVCVCVLMSAHLDLISYHPHTPSFSASPCLLLEQECTTHAGRYHFLHFFLFLSFSHHQTVMTSGESERGRYESEQKEYEVPNIPPHRSISAMCVLLRETFTAASVGVCLHICLFVHNYMHYECEKDVGSKRC